MDIFKLYRHFWDFAFANPDKIKPNHVAIYSFSIEHCNRLGWKTKFGFPTSMAMEATGIKSYSVFKKAFDELVEYGFYDVIEYSKNQYSSNIIALKENCKAHGKALDKALVKHTSKQVKSTHQSIDSIDKQVTNNKETIEQRKTLFYDSLKPFVETYGPKMIREFYEYWTEPNKKNTQLRYEGEKYFDLTKRLATWKRNEKPTFGENTPTVLTIPKPTNFI
jgi:hypothetical protein